MIELIVDGTPYTDFTDATVNVSIETLCNDFSFTASAVNGFPPFRLGQPVVAIVDGVTKCSGHIDEINGSESEGSHTVTYSGRDNTGDFIDSTINIIDDIRPNKGFTLIQLVSIVVDHLGLDIGIIDFYNPPPFNGAEDFIKPEVGQNAFDLVMQYARKRQALLTSDGGGRIVITQSQPTNSGAALQRVAGGDDNNILSQDWSFESSQEFNKYIHRGQLDPTALNNAGESDSETVEDQSGEVINSGSRVGRQRVVVETESYSSQQLSDRALWSAQIAKSKAVRFNCSVKGHQMPQGGVWLENTLAQINSSVADITRMMLINSISFSYAEGQATTTSLEFVEANVYTTNSLLLSQKPTGDQGDAFAGLE